MYCIDIMNNIKINPVYCLTMSSLALQVYFKNYYNSKLYFISISTGKLDEFIRQSYRGGIVEVYKPYLINGYHYDANSLYPYIMSSCLMPVNDGKEGNAEFDIYFNINEFFGFIEVEVECDNLYIPFLTYKNKFDSVISPIGKWIGVYFSEEIKYALTLGYKFKYKKYYKFDKAIIFKDYVNDIYALRLKNRNTSLSSFYKLLLNSLYGRFGMSNLYSNTEIIDNNTSEGKLRYEYLNLLYDIDCYPLKKNKLIINYNKVIELDYLEFLYRSGLIDKKIYNSVKKQLSYTDLNTNKSVHISAAITAYARIYMHKIKVTYQNNLYYSDTDSLILDKKLDSELVSSEVLGLFKLENEINIGYFISPKLYCFIEKNGTTVIKSKGVKNTLFTLNDFKNLYIEKTIKVTKISHFLRSLKKYTLKSRENNFFITGILNKREKKYDVSGNWIDTKPIKINENIK